MLEKVSSKLDSARKVNHADILVKLSQKGFPNRYFQSEAYILTLSTDAERKFTKTIDKLESVIFTKPSSDMPSNFFIESMLNSRCKNL